MPSSAAPDGVAGVPGPPRAGGPPGAGFGLAGAILRVPEVGILVPLIVLVVVFYLLNPSFLYPATIRTIIHGVIFVGIIAVGQTFLLIAGELDLSVGSVAGLCAIVAAWLMKLVGWPVEVAILAGILTGAVAGLINALVTVYVGIPAFIATLGMLYIAKGANRLVSNGVDITPLPQPVKTLGDDIIRHGDWSVTWPLVVFLLAIVAGDLVLRKTVFGRSVYATGGNAEVARIAGINTKLVKSICYVLTGALSALAGILVMADINVGQASIGEGWELTVIASVVIGGVSLFGGAGTVLGTLLGLFIMQVVQSGLVSADVSNHWQNVAVGVIMILAVGVDLLRRRAKLA